MLVLSVSPLQRRQVNITLEDGTGFALYRKESERYGIAEGADISAELMRQILEETLCPRALKRAMFLLEQQDRSEADLRDKLARYPQEAIEYAIDYVKRFHYLDDSRLAEVYVRHHEHDKSRRRLRIDLIRKGIPADIADQAIEREYTASEEEQIARILEQKHYDPQTADDKERARIFRFLSYRGFRTSDILRAIHADWN